MLIRLPVDDVHLVAVVDAGKHLLHEHCGVLLSELASCDNLVEEFSSLADSTSFSIVLLTYSVTI